MRIDDAGSPVYQNNTDSQTNPNVVNGNTVQNNQPSIVEDNGNLYYLNFDAQYKRFSIENLYAQNTATQNNVFPAKYDPAIPGLSREELEKRAKHIHDRFEDDGFLWLSSDTSLSEIEGDLKGLSPADAQALNQIYKEKYGSSRGGRDLFADIKVELSNPEDRFKAYQLLNPQSIHTQMFPTSQGGNQAGIVMEPPVSEMAPGTKVTYRFNPGNVAYATGSQKIHAFILNDPQTAPQNGAPLLVDVGDTGKIDATAAFPGKHKIVFEVQYGDQPPQYYTFDQVVRDPKDLAQSTLVKSQGTAPDADLYMTWVDQQITAVQGQLNTLKQNPQANGDQIKQLEKALDQLQETKREVPSKLFDGAVGKPIPMQAVLIPKETSQPVPLQVYAKPLGNNRWAIVDLTNPTDSRIYEGGGATNEEGLRNAWKEFINNNNLPEGQIAAMPPQIPPGYDRPAGFPQQFNFNPGEIWNDHSDGKSSLKQWADGLSWGSVALAVLGVGALLIPGAEPAAPFLFAAAGATAATSGGLNIADRVTYGNFELWSSQTALDTLAIVGGLAQVGGVAGLLRAGTTTIALADGTSVTLSNAGKFVTISNAIGTGAAAGGGIILGKVYLEQIDAINSNPNLTPEQKQQQTQEILKQAALFGGLMIVGHGLSKIAGANMANRAAVLQTARNNLVKDLGEAEFNNLLRTYGENALIWAGNGGLSGAAARELLTSLDARAISALQNVSGQQAKQLFDLLGADLLKQVAPEIGGQRLTTLVDTLGPDTAKGVISEAARRGRINDLIGFTNNLQTARAGTLTSPPTPLSNSSLVVDANTFISIRKLMTGTRWADLQTVEQNSINQLRAQSGLPPLTTDPTDLTLTGIIGTTDIRVPNVVMGESSTTQGLTMNGLDLTVSRSDPEYVRVLNDLNTSPAIGGNKGFADRGAIADALFAKTEAGVTPKFVTSDKDVYGRLAQRYANPPVTKGPNESWADAVLRQYPNGFNIEVDGHKLFVIPVVNR